METKTKNVNKNNSDDSNRTVERQSKKAFNLMMPTCLREALKINLMNNNKNNYDNNNKNNNQNLDNNNNKYFVFDHLTVWLKLFYVINSD